jgi:peptidoglycan/xylan/chitin deacetylase (PgdA/CDA1 family)
MATFLIGYDVEHQDPAITGAFLEQAVRVHTQLAAPATFFVVGRTLERNRDAFRAIVGNPLFDIQQHTYSHVLLKTVCQENDEGIRIVRGGTLPQIREEVAKTSLLLKDALGLECLGLTGPYNYYRGLADRPDILEILWECGIRYLRTYGRDAHDWQPVSLDVQPFWYEAQGFPGMLEMGITGWQDCILRKKLGWANHSGYLDAVLPNLDEIVRRDLVWSYVQHDWSSIWDDPSMRLTEALLRAVRDRGIEIIHYTAYYQRAQACRPATVDAAPASLATPL